MLYTSNSGLVIKKTLLCMTLVETRIVNAEELSVSFQNKSIWLVVESNQLIGQCTQDLKVIQIPAGAGEDARVVSFLPKQINLVGSGTKSVDRTMHTRSKSDSDSSRCRRKVGSH